MKIAITGSNSGIGQGLVELLSDKHYVISLSRCELDLSDINQVLLYPLPVCNMLINCAGTGIGGKIDFVNHNIVDITNILNINFVSPTLLTHKALSNNQLCKIVNITSTNNNRYWPNDLAYSLSKKSLAEFGSMLKVEYPNVSYLEIQLGLTKTNFNQNRYQSCQSRFTDIYSTNKHLSVNYVVNQIANVLFDDNIKFIEIST